MNPYPVCNRQIVHVLNKNVNWIHARPKLNNQATPGADSSGFFYVCRNYLDSLKILINSVSANNEVCCDKSYDFTSGNMRRWLQSFTKLRTRSSLKTEWFKIRLTSFFEIPITQELRHTVTKHSMNMVVSNSRNTVNLEKIFLNLNERQHAETEFVNRVGQVFLCWIARDSSELIWRTLIYRLLVK